MSEFIDHVKAEIVKRHSDVVRGEQTHPFKIDNENQRLQITSEVYLNTYEFGLRWGYQAKIRENDHEGVEEHRQSAIRELRFAIYGSLTSQLRDLERAVLSGEREAALSALRGIQLEVNG